MKHPKAWVALMAALMAYAERGPDRAALRAGGPYNSGRQLRASEDAKVAGRWDQSADAVRLEVHGPEGFFTHMVPRAQIEALQVPGLAWGPPEPVIVEPEPPDVFSAPLDDATKERLAEMIRAEFGKQGSLEDEGWAGCLDWRLASIEQPFVDAAETSSEEPLLTAVLVRLLAWTDYERFVASKEADEAREELRRLRGEPGQGTLEPDRAGEEISEPTLADLARAESGRSGPGPAHADKEAKPARKAKEF